MHEKRFVYEFHSLFRARRLANGERTHSKPVVRYSHHHRPLISPGNNSESSCSSSAEDCPAAGGGAESAVHLCHSHGMSECVVLYGSIFGWVERGGGDASHCVFYRVDAIGEFTTSSLKKAVCGVLNTQEAWSIFLGVSSTGKVKGCKINQREVQLRGREGGKEIEVISVLGIRRPC